MPVTGYTRRPKDPTSLLKKIREQAKQKDSKAICRSVQADLGVGGTATYEFTSEGDRAAVNLPAEECLIFIIMGGLTLDDSRGTTTARGLGITYPALAFSHWSQQRL